MSFALIAIALSIISGFSDKEAIEALSAVERERLEEQFGSAEEIIAASKELASTFGFGDDLNLATVFPDLSFNSTTEVAVGNQVQLQSDAGLFTGTLVQTPQGMFFRVLKDPSDPESGVGFDAPVEFFNGTFNIVDPDTGGHGGTLEGITTQASNAEILAQLTSDARFNVPQAPDLGEVREPFGEEDLFDIVDRLRGNLNLDPVSFEDFLPSDLRDPDVFQAEQEAALFGREEELVAAGRQTAQRSLVESGILPSSAAFGFETNQAPQLASEGRIADTLPGIAGEAEVIRGRNAELEAGARSQAANINTQLQQIESGLFATGTQFLVAGEGLRQQADVSNADLIQQNFSNEMLNFTTDQGLIDRAMATMTAWADSNANIGVTGLNFAMQTVLSLIEAERLANPDFILTSDILNQAIASVIGIATSKNLIDQPGR